MSVRRLCAVALALSLVACAFIPAVPPYSDASRAERLQQLLPADIILLDNFTIPQLRQAVTLRHECCGPTHPLLEASGGITLENVRAVAETGVDRISIGGLTKDVRALDLSLRFQE